MHEVSGRLIGGERWQCHASVGFIMNTCGRRREPIGPISGRHRRRRGRAPPGVFYYWKGERHRHPNAPQLEGTGGTQIESADCAAGYFTTHSDTHPKVKLRTSGIYLRADPEDMSILDGRDDRKRAELIAERLRHWKSITKT